MKWALMLLVDMLNSYHADSEVVSILFSYSLKDKK